MNEAATVARPSPAAPATLRTDHSFEDILRFDGWYVALYANRHIPEAAAVW